MRTHCVRNATLNLNLNLSKNLQKVFLSAHAKKNPLVKNSWRHSTMHDLVSKDQFDRLPERYRQRARDIAFRVGEIDRLTARCSPEAIRTAGARLCGQLRPQPDIEIEDFAEEFRQACADLPEWAISEATNDYLGGKVENHTGQYMPTCAEFAKHARSIIMPFLGERAGLRREAEKLFERAQDERRRAEIAVERAKPGHREWVRNLARSVTSGASKLTAKPHARDQEMQARIDALKVKREPPPSKLDQTSIVRGEKR